MSLSTHPSRQSLAGRRSAAFDALCACLAASNAAEIEDRFAATARSPAFRWTDFIDLATDHLVAPTVAHRFDQSGLSDAVPDVVARYFSATLRLNRARNEQLLEEAREVAGALNEIGVVPLYLKGSAGLLSGLYDDAGVRIMTDLDILVPPERGDDSVRQLEMRGFRQSGGSRHPRMHNYCVLLREAGPASVDLHQEVLAYPHETILPARDVLAHAVDQASDGARFAVPSPTHQVVLNIAHSQLNDHGYALGHLPLRSLHDLALLLRRDGAAIDWREIDNRFIANGRRTALDYHCLAAREFLDCRTGTDSAPGPITRALLGRARAMIDRPALHRASNRFIRAFLSLGRELSSADLRARLLRNMRDPAWWRRNFAIFQKGGR